MSRWTSYIFTRANSVQVSVPSSLDPELALWTKAVEFSQGKPNSFQVNSWFYLLKFQEEILLGKHLHFDVGGKYFDILIKACVIPGCSLPDFSVQSRVHYVLLAVELTAKGQRRQSFSLGVSQSPGKGNFRMCEWVHKFAITPNKRRGGWINQANTVKCWGMEVFLGKDLEF